MTESTEINQRGPGYHEQHGCHNCQFVFIKSEHDTGPEYFCCVNVIGDARPPCMSVSMDECPGLDFSKGDDELNNAFDKWDAWSASREVAAHGTCNNWIHKE